jgi:hypothetical protein
VAIEVVEHYRRGGFDYLRNAQAPDELAIPTFVASRETLPHRGLQRKAAEGERAKVSSYANYHWLRPNMDGFVTSEEVQNAFESDKFFIRKVSLERFPSLRDLFDRKLQP